MFHTDIDPVESEAWEALPFDDILNFNCSFDRFDSLLLASNDDETLNKWKAPNTIQVGSFNILFHLPIARNSNYKNL